MTRYQKTKKELEEAFDALCEGVINETIDLPNNAFVILNKDVDHIFTKKRLEVIDYINKNHPASIQELANGLHRKKQAVDRDLKIFETYRIVKLVKSGRTVCPLVKKPVVFFNLQKLSISTRQGPPIAATA